MRNRRRWRWIAAAALATACGDDGNNGPPADAASSSGAAQGTAETGRGDSSSGSPESTTTATAGTSADSSGGDDTGGGPAYPPPDGHPPNTGPGGPAVDFRPDQLYQGCAFLDGGATDIDHHNLVVMFDGYLMMPWAPEFGNGGITFFDISDPCAPLPLSSTAEPNMRETHATGFAQVDDRYYAVVAAKEFGLAIEGGIMIWDVTNVAAPVPVSTLYLPGHLYPDAYARVVLSAVWQAPYIYVAGADNGLYIIDASDPSAPVLVEQFQVDPILRFGQINVVGNLLVATAAEGPRTVLLDVSVPQFPQPIVGGDFEIVDAKGVIRESYSSNVEGGYVYYAIKNNAGGLLVMDIHDPSAPTLAGHLDSGGNGGYVFAKEGHAFVGESSFAGVYDVSDPAAIELLTTLDLPGDLDTATPIGNVVVLSVDDESAPNEASQVVPYLAAADTLAPEVTWTVPDDGATGLPITARAGATFSEMIDVKSAWEGSVRLYRVADDGSTVPVAGWISVQENVVNFAPRTPLDPGTTYTFEIPAGGIADYNGNRIEQGVSIELTTIGGQ